MNAEKIPLKSRQHYQNDTNHRKPSSLILLPDKGSPVCDRTVIGMPARK